MSSKTIVRGDEKKEFEDEHHFQYIRSLLDEFGDDYEVKA